MKTATNEPRVYTTDDLVHQDVDVFPGDYWLMSDLTLCKLESTGRPYKPGDKLVPGHILAGRVSDRDSGSEWLLPVPVGNGRKAKA